MTDEAMRMLVAALVCSQVTGLATCRIGGLWKDHPDEMKACSRPAGGTATSSDRECHEEAVLWDSRSPEMVARLAWEVFGLRLDRAVFAARALVVSPEREGGRTAHYRGCLMRP